MRKFDYDRSQARPRTDDAVILAGGTDLIPLMKIGRVAPTAVFDVKGGAIDAGIDRSDDGWRIGAATTLARLQDDETIASELPVIHQAISSTATRQIRNRATVGGNLLQRSRCWYYRDGETTCWLAGGDECLARTGRNDHHAIFDTGPCVTTQPSDLAAALVALDATVTICTDDVTGSVAVADFLCAPDERHRSLNTLADGGVVESISIPPHSRRRSCYVKAMDRAAWQFALVGVAVVMDGDDGPRLVASGVASTPWRLTAAEEAMRGRPLDDDVITAASEAAPNGAEPLDHNGYKSRLLVGLTRRALEAVR